MPFALLWWTYSFGRGDTDTEHNKEYWNGVPLPSTINLKKPDFLDGILIGPYICIMPCSHSITERDTKGSKTFLSPLPNNSLMWILTNKQAGDYCSTEEGEAAY